MLFGRHLVEPLKELDNELVVLRTVDLCGDNYALSVLSVNDETES
jgi:hypothetical protein